MELATAIFPDQNAGHARGTYVAMAIAAAILFFTSLLLHEFGHALGLGHSTVGDATMYPSVGYCSINMRWLAEDDKQGAEYVYPSAGTNTPPARANPMASAATLSRTLDGI